MLMSQLRIPGLAAWKAVNTAQQVFTKVNQDLEHVLTEDERASLIEARGQEVGVSVYIGLVIANTASLNAEQKGVLQLFHTTAQAERVARLLVDQSCPELAQAAAFTNK